MNKKKFNKHPPSHGNKPHESTSIETSQKDIKELKMNPELLLRSKLGFFKDLNKINCVIKQFVCS